jgi:hypothetical protein
LIWNVDVKKHCKGLEYSDCSELMRGIALLDELKEDLILELLRG